ncbi:MAG TPA: hypothetical protein VLJ38_03650, partial [Polyangiaceae bacterium]|nr:hypothetical protein [Polyangiaceae bacterium]
VTEHTINERTKLTLNATSLATDPIRPYAYVAVGSDVAVYNVYSGAHLTTFSNVAPNIGDMVVSSDGARLFVIDTTNFAVVPVDLEHGNLGVSWPLGDAAPASVAYTRRRGQGLVITGNGSFFDATTGERFAARFSGGYYGNVVVSASRDGSRFCALDMGLSPYSMGCTALDFDAGASGIVLGSYVSAQSSGNWGVGSNGQDVALTSDGSRAFVASGAPYDFRGYDTSTGSVLQALPGDAYPNNVEVTDQGLLVAGASVWYDDNDVWVYDAAGFLLASHKLSGYAQALRPRQLKASGDGLRLVALTDDPLLAFVTAVP